MNLVNVTDNVFLVKGINDGRFPHSHSILILDKDSVLIDTGCGIEILKQIKRRFNISNVINSHTHPDHSAGNWVFNDKPIYVPEEGFSTSGSLKELSRRFVGKKLAKYWREFIKKNMEFKNCEPTNSYYSHTVFNFGNKTLKAIFTPGHTNDHYCFFEPEEKILFSFDYDLTSFPWYGHSESSITEFIKSVNKLKALSPEVVVSSHRGLITENIETEFHIFLKQLEKRDMKILSLLENGKTITQLVELAPIYGNFPYAEPLLQYWEEQMIRKHLEQLKFNGKIGLVGDRFERLNS